MVIGNNIGVHSKELQTLISPIFDENLLVDILQQLNNCKNCVIKDITFNNDFKKGDSYLSIVRRFVVNWNGTDKRTGQFRSEVFNCIAKTLPTNIGRRKTFRSTDFFQNEVIFYNIVWKAMDEFQKSKVSDRVFDEIPLYLSGFADGHKDYVVLEDLSCKNYVGINRGNGLDIIHTRLIMRLFAKFHALSLAFKNQQPKKYEEAAFSLKETYFAEKYRSWYEPFQTNTLFRILRDAVEKQLPRFYLDRLNKLLETDLFGILIYHCNTAGPLSVITHGDAWIPNFLVNYDKLGTPLSAIILDFQLARYASLANDIMFFLYACTEQSLRVQHWDNLIEDYHQTFIQTVTALGSDPNLMTLDDLKAEIKAKAVYGIGMSMESIVMSMLEDDETVDLDLIQNDQGEPLESVWIVHPFKQEEKRQRLADMIKHAVDNDFI